MVIYWFLKRIYFKLIVYYLYVACIIIFVTNNSNNILIELQITNV